jgi:hypothetical protein
MRKVIIIILGEILYFCLILGAWATEPLVQPKQQPKEIQIYGGPLGQSAYLMPFALSDLINKNSTWLRATAIQTKGTMENVRILQKYPERRANAVIWASPMASFGAANGLPPFTERFIGIKFLSLGALNGSWFVSINPQIRTAEDLVGKRIGYGPKAGGPDIPIEFTLRHGYGILDKVKVTYLGGDAVKDALLDGMIDAGVAAVVITDEKMDWVPTPAFNELFNTKSCYLISLDAEVQTKTRNATGIPMGHEVLKPKEWGKTKAQPWTVQGHYNSFGVHESMNDDIVLEILRVIYENTERFADYNIAGKGLKKETMTKIGCKRTDFHPAAVKFFQEKGVRKIGLLD